jgi:hypothetical protein
VQLNDILRDERERGWFHLDNAIIDEYLPKIGVTAFAVYACIVRHSDRAGNAFPSYTTLQKELGCGRAQVAAAIKKIVDAGLVTITTGARSSNLYHVVTVSTSSNPKLVPMRNQFQIGTATSSAPEPELVPNRNSNNTHLTRPNEQGRKTPPAPSPGEPAGKPPRALRGTRIPADFALTPRLYEYAASKGVTAAEADSETEEFKLYWESASGTYALKTDWEKTWMRRILDRVASGKIGPVRRLSPGYANQATINRGGQRNPDGTPRWTE